MSENYHLYQKYPELTFSVVNVRQALLLALEGAKEEINAHTGICHQDRIVTLKHSQRLGGAAEDLLQELLEGWPKFSGDESYPINSDKNEYPKVEYINASLSVTLWDKNTEYGKLRWELLEYLIEELKREQ